MRRLTHDLAHVVEQKGSELKWGHRGTTARTAELYQGMPAHYLPGLLRAHIIHLI